MDENKFISVIINNYNYARYLRCCIESVLSQNYSYYELIIVDDGSTDESHEILNEYIEHAKIITKENGGQGSAYNSGFSQASGDLILFLDADDLLLPHALDVVNQSWEAGAAKLHYKLEIIDEYGHRSGICFPESLDNGDVRQSIAQFGSYASPPASGNVYSRYALESILPMESSDWRIAADSYTIFLSPFSGHVISVLDTLGLYRIDYSKKIDLPSRLVFNNSPSTPWDTYLRAYQTSVCIAKKINELGYFSEPVGPFMMSPSINKLRVISLRVFGVDVKNKGVPNNFNILYEVLNSTIKWPSFSLRKKVIVCIWFILMLGMPKLICRYIAGLSIKKIIYKNR